MSKKAIAVYVRVSTAGQDLQSQEPDLKAWLKSNRKGRRVRWYQDKFTGTTMRRPGMGKLEADVHAGQVGAVVVWRLDRLGRTAVELLSWLKDLEDAGVEFVSVRDSIDTSTAAGKLLRTILAGFAEYEREVISERVRAGIKKARASGKQWGGRKPGARTKLTPQVLRTIRSALREGTSKAEVARQLHVDRSTVYDAIALLELS